MCNTSHNLAPGNQVVFIWPGFWLGVQNMNVEMSQETIAAMDAVLVVAAPRQWRDRPNLAKWAAASVADRLAIDEVEAEKVVLRYLTALDIGSEAETEPRKIPRYNHAALLADAYASASASLDGRGHCYMSSGEYGFDAR